MHKVYFVSTLMFIACASPTKFVPKKNDGFGYDYRPLPGTAYTQATFEGNAQTDASTSETYARLAADQYCIGQGKMGIPLSPYVYPQENRPGLFAIGQPFICVKTARTFSFLKHGVIQELGPEELAKSFQDGKGALFVKSTTDKNSAVVAGDILLSLEGSRIGSSADLREILDELNVPNPLIKILRKMKKIEVRVPVIDETAETRAIYTDTLKKECALVPAKPRPKFCEEL